jgi:hypothetical protein
VSAILWLIAFYVIAAGLIWWADLAFRREDDQ